MSSSLYPYCSDDAQVSLIMNGFGLRICCNTLSFLSEKVCDYRCFMSTKQISWCPSSSFGFLASFKPLYMITICSANQESILGGLNIFYLMPCLVCPPVILLSYAHLFVADVEGTLTGFCIGGTFFLFSALCSALINAGTEIGFNFFTRLETCLW